MGKQGQKEQDVKRRKDRGSRWALWETLLVCHVVIVIKNKFAQGMGVPEMMHEFNRLFGELADEWEKNNLLLDHNGLPDRRVSAAVSKQHRISVVESSTRSTPISRRFEAMVCAVRNGLLPILDKQVLVDGKIPSGRKVEECHEELHVLYQQHKSKDDHRPASGDEDDEGEGGTKTFNLEDFHPHEFYVVCKYGPTVIGGAGEVYFLKDAQDMQEALENGAGNRNGFREKKRKQEQVTAGEAKRKVLTDTLFSHSDNSASPAVSSVSSRSFHSDTGCSSAYIGSRGCK